MATGKTTTDHDNAGRWSAADVPRRLDRIREYAELASCRRQFLLAYFGEEETEACGNCEAGPDQS